MGSKVNFINISSKDYQELENKDSYSFYKCYDTDRCYLGEEEITNQELNSLVQQTQDTLRWNEMRPHLDSLTPAEIQAIVQSGKANNYWDVGDKIAIILNGDVSTYTFDNEICYAYIIGFNHNMEVETAGGYNMTLQFGKVEDGLDIAFVDPNYDGTIAEGCGFQMNTTSINSGGWESSYMRNNVCVEFYQALPQDWQDIITPVIKYTNNQGNSNNSSGISATEDQIFLLSEYELCGQRVYANLYEQNDQQQYDYYKSGDYRIKYKHLNSDSTTAYWLRSPYYNNNYTFCYITDGGIASRYNANFSYGFAPSFVIS